MRAIFWVQNDIHNEFLEYLNKSKKMIYVEVLKVHFLKFSGGVQVTLNLLKNGFSESSDDSFTRKLSHNSLIA